VLDEAQVTSVLRRHLDPDATCTDLERGPVGNGQETWFLVVDTGRGRTDLVLRRTAEAGPLEWTDRGAEARAMNLVADQGLPVPRVHWVQPDPAELGQPYLVMDRAPGSPVMLVGPDERSALIGDLVGQVARLHAAAIPPPAGSMDAVRATREEIERWHRHYVENRVAPVPIIGALLAWLDAHVPSVGADPAVLVWGDAGAHNVLHEDGRITALLDWELAHAGHPLEDLGALAWMELDHGGDTERIVRAYESVRGVQVDRDDLDYFVILTCVTRAIMILIGAAAFVTGRTHAPNLAGLGLDLPAVNLARAAALAGWGHVDVPPAPQPVPQRDGLRPAGAEIDRGIARFLRHDVLPQVADRRTRRGLKTAAALLDTAALGAEAELVVERERARLGDDLAVLLRGRGVDASDVEAAVRRVELDPGLADLRSAVRTYLLTDLALQRSLLSPLRDLYER
jgi:aminoglycoside phosphotransferase (APT) family kinase protein